MRNKLTLLCVGCLSAASLFSQKGFENHFNSKTLRFDYYRCGTNNTEQIFIEGFAEEPFWGGSRVNLIDTTARGEHFVNVYDKKSGELIFSQGHNSLFQEWRTIPEATQIAKAFPESFTMPYPKEDVRIEFLSRNRKGIYQPVFQTDIAVNSPFVRKERKPYTSFEVFNSGHYAKKVDIVILPEGYTEGQYEQFQKDCREFSEAIFAFEPYKSNRTKFNVRGVWAPSKDSGPDIPGEGIWSNTVLDAGFYTFGSERYQMTYDYKKVKDLAGTVPYDYIYILSNTTKYGGGGIYNFYGIGASANPGLAAKVHVHEFGHLFTGLGDEYADNGSTEDLYPLDVEPWEANITTLVDFDRKWKNMIDAKTPVPTPVEEKYRQKVGLFEGAGYMTKGIYRPVQKCLMREFGGVETFCPVCIQAIEKQIEWITK
ncbi:MAG: M64 family metallopeptidase [Bacteroidales bacterium]